MTSLSKGVVEEEDMRGTHRAASQASSSAAADLPASPYRPKRWVPQRKAEVVAAVERGELSCAQACALHTISFEEFVSWQRDIALFGLAGLRVSGAQRHRRLRVPSALPKRM